MMWQRIWTDPVWSKVIAGLILGTGAVVLAVVPKDPLPLGILVAVVLLDVESPHSPRQLPWGGVSIVHRLDFENPALKGRIHQWAGGEEGRSYASIQEPRRVRTVEG